ncbi:MAG: hypothetical protein VX599_07735 [Pseudomonadota bacterium]|nr:hypothetical protein [Pseudomonadota bacterium]
MADKMKTPDREARLKSALRDNLKRRKAASRKAQSESETDSKPAPRKP